MIQLDRAQPRRAARRLPGAADRAVAREPDDAGRRALPARLRRLPHPPLHDRHDRPERRSPRAPSTTTSTRRFQSPALRADLRGAVDRARPPPLPRDLEHHPDRRLGQAEPQPDLPAALERSPPWPSRSGFASVPIAFCDGGCRSRPVGRDEPRRSTPASPTARSSDKWQNWLDDHRLVGPRQRGEHTVIVVGTGPRRRERRRDARRARATGSRRSASRTRPGGRTRSRPRAGSTPPRTTPTRATRSSRLFVDTMKGGDFRAREANVWRLAETSTNIIDQAVAQGVPFNREYGGMLATRSFGGVLVERTFYCRGQTGQQLLLGAYSALQRQVAEGQARVHNRHELLDVVARRRPGARDHRPQPGHRRDRAPRRRRRRARHRRLLQRLLPLDQRDGLQRDRGLARAPPRRGVREPLLHPDPSRPRSRSPATTSRS